MHLSHRHRRRLPVAATERTRREGGYVLALFALLLVPLLLMSGLAVDVGAWYNRASDAQKAADAAALAGVVFLPDEPRARTVALEVARRNGFDNADPNITVTAQPSTKAPRRLHVTIRDDRVGSFFYSNLGGGDITIDRDAFAEYTTPVPMGSPRNFFGTGLLLDSHGGSQFPAEYLYQSVNPYCTDKENGDRYQSMSDGATCDPRQLNTEYRDTGYELYIEAPEGRSSPIEVRLYDPRYNVSPISARVPGDPTCTTTYPNSWTDVVTNQRLDGPAQYQTGFYFFGYWIGGSTIDLPAGQSVNLTADRARFRLATENCSPTETTVEEAAIDDRRQNGNEDYTFTLYQADDTPLDDSDNPVICQETYSLNTPFDGYRYLGSSRWNTLCEIPHDAPDGKYILRVTNSGRVGSPQADGSNQWGLVAKYSGAAGDGLCDGRNDAMCPRVYGRDAISVRAAATTRVASFYLAEIGPEHAGKLLRLELFDPGEGGSSIEIQEPTGTDSWRSVPVSWVADRGGGSGSGTSIDVTRSRFNGKTLVITIDLENYQPPANNRWWQIKYTFAGNVTDRTTWSAKIIGDPIHLVEEN